MHVSLSKDWVIVKSRGGVGLAIGLRRVRLFRAGGSEQQRLASNLVLERFDLLVLRGKLLFQILVAACRLLPPVLQDVHGLLKNVILLVEGFTLSAALRLGRLLLIRLGILLVGRAKASTLILVKHLHQVALKQGVSVWQIWSLTVKSFQDALSCIFDEYLSLSAIFQFSGLLLFGLEVRFRLHVRLAIIILSEG